VPEAIPIAPPELQRRVAGPGSDDANYEENGRLACESILELLPPDWAWQGRRVLDYGCGPGRVLRHLTRVAPQAELHGCDPHEPSIRWLQENSPERVVAFVNSEEPPLDRPDGFFDLIYVVSVFTHLTDSWSRWLLELHRLLKPDGLLVSTFAGETDHRQYLVFDDPWDEDRIGMNVLAPAADWDAGGPAVFHSRWWLEAHWGRAFDVLSVTPDGFGGLTQGSLLLRKRDVRLEPEDLERPEPGEPRELAAALHNVRQLSNELGQRQGEIEHLRWHLEQARKADPPPDEGGGASGARGEQGVRSLLRRLRR